MNRPSPLYDAVCDDKVNIAHKLDVDTAPPLLVDVLPIPLMRCLDMHMSTINNPNSIGHIPLKKITLNVNAMGSGQTLQGQTLEQVKFRWKNLPARATKDLAEAKNTQTAN